MTVLVGKMVGVLLTALIHKERGFIYKDSHSGRKCTGEARRRRIFRARACERNNSRAGADEQRRQRQRQRQRQQQASAEAVTAKSSNTRKVRPNAGTVQSGLRSRERPVIYQFLLGACCAGSHAPLCHSVTRRAKETRAKNSEMRLPGRPTPGVVWANSSSS